MLVSWVLEGAAEEGARTTLIDLADLYIEPCTACESCALTGECVHTDDFPYLYQQILEADALVLGSPVYIDNITGQMKLFVDRLADAIHYQVLTGRYGTAVATTRSSGGEDVVAYLGHVINYLGAFALPGMSVALGDEPEAIHGFENRARHLGRAMATAVKEQPDYPDQAAVIAENRACFAKIVRENRDWRPGEYEDWVKKGWMSDEP